MLRVILAASRRPGNDDTASASLTIPSIGIIYTESGSQTTVGVSEVIAGESRET